MPLIPPSPVPQSSFRTLEDKVHPDELEEKLKLPQYNDLKVKNFIKTVDSDFHYFEPSPLFEVNDTCDVNNSEANSHSVKKISSISVESENPGTGVLFDFGDGDDTATGYQYKKNIFKGGKGVKKYTGGKHADAFYLSSPVVPNTPSNFNGLEEEDIIIADHDLTGTAYPGYAINLEAQRVYYRSHDGTFTLVANLHHIEHALGHKKTQDVLTGDHQNNVLNGMGGKDAIWGKGGADNLILEEGEAHGGEGVDSYIILKNRQDHPVEVNIYDKKGNISLITLPSEGFSFSLIKDKATTDQYSIQITVDALYEDIPATTIFIRNAYQVKNQDTLKLSGQYIFSTEDGLLLFPDWPETITIDQSGNFTFTPKFYAQYSVVHDIKHQAYFKNTPENNISISLEKRDSNDDVIIVCQEILYHLLQT